MSLEDISTGSEGGDDDVIVIDQEPEEVQLLEEVITVNDEGPEGPDVIPIGVPIL